MSTNIEKGVIIRMYMENFVTYDSAVFKPGRNLNLIIGPNGTGKSTVVCAIVLGLGGKPKVIGRADKVSNYVKAGCESAKIEIELTDTGKKSIVIARRFNLNNQSTWMINGKPVAVKEVQAVTKQLNIQVDNLCQFLPQDKVQSFSEMDSKSLLIETERSVGHPLLLEYHERLIEFRSIQKNLEAEVASKSRSLENKEQRYEGLKEIVGNIKEKKTIKKKIVSLNQKKHWMLYDQLRQHFIDAKVKRDEVALQMKELDEQLKPINAMIGELKSRVKVVQKSVSDQSNQYAARITKVQQAVDDVQSHEEQIREIEETRDRRIEAEQSRDQQINHQQQQKNKLDNDLRSMLQEFGSEEALFEQQNQTLQLVDEQRRIIDTFQRERDTLKYKGDQIDRDIRNHERELQLAKEVETQRLELLRNKNPDAYRGVLWLRDNRQMFSAPVHEPMFLHINVKNPMFSKYLENSISYNDMIAFVCENTKDMNLLVKCLRDQQKLVVNIVHSNPDRQVRMNPNIPLDQIKQFGFEHYLVSLVEAPPTIMKYIVQNFNLNNIPVGTEAVEDNMDRIPDTLSYFFSKSNVYAVSRSRYTGDKSVRQNAVSGNGMLSITVDSARLNGIYDRISQLKNEKQGIAQQIQEMEAHIKEADKKMVEYRNIRSLCQQNIQKIQALRSRISMADAKIKKLQEERTNIEEIRAIFKAEIHDTIETQHNAYRKLNSLLEDCFSFEQVSGEAKLELKFQTQALRKKENDSQELRDRCDDAERTFKTLEEELRPLKNEVDKLYKEALATTNGLSPQDKGFKPFNTAFEKLPSTIEEVEEDLRTSQAKVFCMAKNDDSENILQEFEKVQKELEDLRQVLKTKRGELETVSTETETLRNKWIPLLEQLVDRINENFSRYFSEMKCAGEVSLTHDDNIMDFNKYGLKIRVKFRDADKLQELTRHHQSGGERAVTTAVYMISLQELSRVPFRCVDEINQGMDAINERRIFELIVNITGRSDSSQYFLLTPKLLPNLQYSNSATVHCVHNGQFMISHKDYDVAYYCNLIQKNG